jgi:hypothetical protein
MIVYANGRVIGTDIDGNAQFVSIIGAEQDTLKIGDDESRTLLAAIIKELKIMNLHLSLMTDNVIERTDVGV